MFENQSLNNSSVDKNSNQRLRNLLLASDDGYWEWNIQTNAVYFSPAWKKMLGYEEDELPNLFSTWIDLLHPDDQHAKDAAQQLSLNASTNFRVEFRMQCKDGHYKWILSRAKVIQYNLDGKPYSIVGTHVDIDDIKAYQTDIEILQNKYQSVIENTPNILFSCKLDSEWTMQFISHAIEKVIGYKASDFIGSTVRTYKSIIYPQDRELVRRTIDNALQSSHKYHLSYRLINISGEIVWVEEYGQKIMTSDGEYLIEGSITDISKQKEDEFTLQKVMQQLQREKEHFYSLLKNASDGIHILDTQGNLILYSDSFAKMIGLDNTTSKKLHVSDWCATLSAFKLELMIHDLIQNPNTFEAQYKYRDGNIFDVQISAKGITLDGKTYLYAAARDISEQKSLQQSIAQEQKLISTIIDTADAIIAVIQADGTMSRINRYAQEFVGYTQKEITSKPYFWKRFLPTNVQDKVVSVITNAQQGKVIKQFQNSWISKEGEERMFEWSNTLVQKSDGSMDYLFTIGLDITEQILMQKEVQESEYRWKLAVEGSGDGLWDWDMLNNAIYFSAQWKALIGYKEDEIENKFEEWESRVHPEDMAQIYRDLQKHIDGEKEFYQNEHRLKCKDGSYQWILAKGLITTRDSNNKPLRMIGTHTNIDKSKKDQEAIKEAESKFHMLFEESLDGIGLLNFETQHFVEFNTKAHEMYGYSYKEFQKITLQELEVQEMDQEIIDRQETIRKEGWNKFTTKHRTKHGEIKNISVSMKPIALEGNKLLYVSFHDITDEVKLRERLLELKDLAERADRAKSEFLANMSHEIRTPLNGIIGLTDIVLKEQLPQTQRDYLSKVQHSSHSLLYIINDILDYSKIEAGKLDIIPNHFTLDELIQGVSNLFGFKIYEKGLAFSFYIDANIPQQLIGDSLRLLQILNNLVGNAVKFTAQGSIELSIHASNISDQYVDLEFLVQDTGIGISQNNQQKLFKPFGQADSSMTKKYSGTGLGLSISKQLLDMMGGKIWIDSKLNEGATFGFTLSLPYKSHPIPLYDQLKGKCILVLDDSLHDREYLYTTLSSWGAKTTLALDKSNILALIAQKEFDFILINAQLSSIDSITLLEYIHNSTPQTQSIIMLSTYYKSSFLLTLKERDVLYYATLEKPFTPSSLYHTIVEGNHTSENQESTPSLHLQSNKQALLVEDNETNQLVASLLLQEYGFKVSIAQNGEEAVKHVREKAFDIIFMDLQMPIMDGYEATRIIRTFNQTIPIIALSAAVMQKDKEHTHQAGMQYHLAKPIIPQEFEKVIQNYFELQKSQTTLGIMDDSHSNDIEIDGQSITILQKELFIEEKQKLYQLYQTFYKSYHKETTTLSTFELNSKEMANFLHKLKGASGTLKFNRLYQQSIEVEQNKATATNIAQIELTLNQICNEIKEKILPRIKKTKSKLPLHHSTLHVMDAIIDKLSHMKPIPSIEIDTLIMVLREWIDTKEIIQIETFAHTMEYRALQSLLLKLREELV